jgi:hypothetical protein
MDLTMLRQMAMMLTLIFSIFSAGSLQSISAADAWVRVNRSTFSNRAVHPRLEAGKCQPLPARKVRQRILNIALREWAAFGYQSLDLSKPQPAAVPNFPPPSAARPRSERAKSLLTRIAGFWAVAPFGIKHIEDQNRRWMAYPDQEWRDHWSAAFTSWVMCRAGLTRAQFRRSIAHIEYIKYSVENDLSIFGPKLPPSLPDEGDLLCASEGKVDRDRPVDPGELESLRGLLLHCYIVVRSAKSATYVVGGNVIDWSRTPRDEFGGVGLLIVDTNTVAARGSFEQCEDNKPCWLLLLRLKTNEHATYLNSPLSSAAKALIEKADEQ